MSGTIRTDWKTPPHLWPLTKHMQAMMMDHALGPRPTSVSDGRHVTILALISRGLLRFVEGRKATAATALGSTAIRKLLAAEAEALMAAEAV